MALADRLLGVDANNPKIPIHAFQAILAEWARGNITGAQAQTALDQASGSPLTAGEITEAQNLVNSVTSIPITGSQAAQADGRARRALRMFEIDQVLLMADAHLPPYDNPAAVKTRLNF